MLAPLLWGGACIAVAQLAFITTSLPVLALWRGPLGLVLLCACALASAARAWPRPLPRPSPVMRFVLPALLYTACGLHYTAGIQATGDEVEYLLLAQSLWREHDLDVQDNFARGEHLEYTAGLDAAPFGTYRQDGRPISTHSPGLPLLLAPVYALGGRRACVLALALIAAWLVVQVHALALRLTGTRDAALLAWLMALGPPVFFYSFHAYTEVPCAALALFALRVLIAPRATPARAMLAGLAVMALPWLHVKMIPAAAVLGLLGLMQLRGRARLAFAAASALLLGAYCWHYWRIFGDPTPLALYGSRVPKKIKRADPSEALPGLFLDSSFGLLPNAPAFLLALAGLFSLRRRWNPTLAAATAVALAVLLPLVAWQTWWAGHCPPARFLVPLAPWLALLAALRVADAPTGLASWRWPLAGGSLLLALFMSLQPHEHLMLNDRANPTRVWEALAASGASLGRYLPLLVSGERAESRVAALWAALLTALLLFDAWSRRTRSAWALRLFRGPGLALSLLTLAGALIDRLVR